MQVTVLIVFAAGMLATRLAPRHELDRSIHAGLLATAASSVTILFVSLFSPTFLPFLCAMSVFLLGMGIVSPLVHCPGALSVRRERRCGLGTARFLADDKRRRRCLAGRHGVA
ncbi:hypothetical protein LJR220_005848 [Bradyrhizobium sp. LjRoot220]|uniref:hypothetical protein n=1 Tax=Bradyrhizobium sp. LjRoot220 TaxID=3342284 RepID=UPI003ECE0699